MYQVIKRDGATAEFNIAKIATAITKAFEAQQKQYHPSVIDLLALKVTADFEPKIKDGKIAVEDIQDSVEEVLILSLIHISGSNETCPNPRNLLALTLDEC